MSPVKICGRIGGEVTNALLAPVLNEKYGKVTSDISIGKYPAIRIAKTSRALTNTNRVSILRYKVV